jgi:hypothetical protein
MWAQMGDDAARLRERLTHRTMGGESPVAYRATDITRSINLAMVWATRMSGPDRPVGEEVIPREWMYGQGPTLEGFPGQPSRYRYVVAIRGADEPNGNQNWRTVVINSDTNLSIDAIRQTSFATFGSIEGRYARFRGTGISDDSEWVIQLASYRT